MGELAGNFNQDSPEATAARDTQNEPSGDEKNKGIETGVPDCYADDVNNRDKLPIFKVDHDSFYQNMNYGRKRIRFRSGTSAQKFMQGSRYKQSFWIQHDKDGYMRKIK